MRRHRSRQGPTEVGARVNGQVDLVDVLVRIRGRLGPSNRALVVRVADLELVVVGGEGLQLGCFDLISVSESLGLLMHRQLAHLDSEVNVGTSENSAPRDLALEVLVLRHHVVQANRGIRNGLLFLSISISIILSSLIPRVDRHRVVQRDNTLRRAVRVDIIELGRAASPKDDRVGVRVTGSNTVGEVQLRRVKGRAGNTALHNAVNRDTQSGVVRGRTAVVQIACVARRGRGGRGQHETPGDLHFERNQSTRMEMMEGLSL